jgi:hypothetical protein
MARRRPARASAQPGSTRRVRRDRTDDAGPETGTGAAGTDTRDAADRAGCATRASGAEAGGPGGRRHGQEAHRNRPGCPGDAGGRAGDGPMISIPVEAAESVALVYAVGLRRAAIMIEVPTARIAWHGDGLARRVPMHGQGCAGGPAGRSSTRAGATPSSRTAFWVAPRLAGFRTLVVGSARPGCGRTRTGLGIGERAGIARLWPAATLTPGCLARQTRAPLRRALDYHWHQP